MPRAELDANTDVVLQKTDKPVRPGRDRIVSAKAKDETWIHHASDIILNKGSKLDDGDRVTWAGFNSSRMHEDTVKPRAITGVLPMFPDKAASVSMVKHTMCITRDAIQFLYFLKNTNKKPGLSLLKTDIRWGEWYKPEKNRNRMKRETWS